ncbi:MAG: diguanylate phosphodiesterase [Gammaproteobacteria bacterium]|nr:MAG: diguanylate phosphodiesterase [Gammaproteobacteria bacterium]
MVENTTARFFSLKWKSALLFGLMILIINSLIPILVYWNLQQKFNFSREQTQQQFQQELVGQLRNSSEQLQRLAQISLLPENATGKDINRLLQSHRIQLELDWHITQAQLFNHDLAHVAGWGESIPAQIQNNITSVFKNERPYNFINCSQGCKQYDLIPVLHKGKIKHVLLLAYDLSNSFFEFSNKTAADIAVLTSVMQDSTPSKRLIPNWKMEVSALTSPGINRDYLLTLSKQGSFAELSASKSLLRYDFLPVEFNIVNSSNDVHFIIIDNIEQQQKEITDITFQSLFISLIGVFIFGIGIFVIVSRPLLRLSIVSQALPLLAKQQYSHVRKLISAVKRKRTIDELDQLAITTHTLTTQLEDLHISVNERSNALEIQSAELQQERDFVRSLIDTAPLIIITINQKGDISSFNDFAETITGYTEEQSLNTPASKFIGEEEWQQLKSGLLTFPHATVTKQHQSELTHHNGTMHVISWLHTRISNPTDSAIILSVGLDITEQKRNENEIVWLADHDVLTQLYNRRKFNIEFTHILDAAKRFNHQGSLLFLDLDQFKDINDSCGHKAGDTVLQEVARLLASIIRSTDIVARLGGDEFAILLPEIDNSGAILLAEKIIKTIGKMDIRFNEVSYKLTTSIGLVQFPLGELSIEDLISNADLAMYQAKAHGKNTWQQFNLDSKARLQLETRVLWKHRIENALKNDLFVFHYQPIIDLKTRTVSHYEILIRMRSEDGKKIYAPGQFIEIAEQTGLINSIDHYVLEQGIFKQAELDAQNKGICLSLNLSGNAVDDVHLLPLFHRLLDESKANPEHLIFELTETSAVADIEQAKTLMNELTKLGCRFSLDDFGTGFASFHYMRELPMDIVKIDGSFISNLVNSPDDQLFVKALVDIAKGMGKKTIAEFVEDAATLALLTEMGIDYAQGYYIGKPEPEFLDGPPILK